MCPVQCVTYVSGRSSISLNRNELEKLAVTPTPLRRKQMVGLSKNGTTCHFLVFLGLFVAFYRAFVRRKIELSRNRNAYPSMKPAGVVRIADNLSRKNRNLQRPSQARTHSLIIF